MEKTAKNQLLVVSNFLKKIGIQVHKIDRDGDINYYGPGQLVGYPILDLKEYKKDLHWLIRSSEEVFIRLLKEFNITAKRIPGLTGVWVDDKKIVTICFGVKKWVTYHGFAFNINPSNLKHFQYIVPCDITDKGVTSLQKLLFMLPVDKDEIIDLVIKYFLEVFEMELIKSKYKAI